MAGRPPAEPRSGAGEAQFDEQIDRAYRLAWAVCGERGCSEAAVRTAFALVPGRRAGASLMADVHREACRRASPGAGCDALRGLSAEQRQTLMLAVFGRLSAAEIAAATGRPRAQVVAQMSGVLHLLAPLRAPSAACG